jgi:hypothetical protein
MIVMTGIKAVFQRSYCSISNLCGASVSESEPCCGILIDTCEATLHVL